MKKIYFAAAFAAMSFVNQAQPVVDASNFPTNLSAESYTAEADGFDPGTPGTDKTWDFSDLDLTYSGAFELSPADGTPYATSYTLANHAHYYDGDLGEMWAYYALSDERYEQVSMVIPNIIAISYGENPRTYLEFPLEYNDSFTDTYKASGSPEMSFTSTYDSYGTLIMPFGTIENVIRQKVVEAGLTNYIWYNSETLYPIIQTALEDNSMGIIKASALGTGTHDTKQFSVYPNPTSGLINVALPQGFEGNLSVGVYDMVGKCFSTKDNVAALDGNNLGIDLSNCRPGIYMVKISGNGNQLVTRKIIKK